MFTANTQRGVARCTQCEVLPSYPVATPTQTVQSSTSVRSQSRGPFTESFRGENWEENWESVRYGHTPLHSSALEMYCDVLQSAADHIETLDFFDYLNI